MVKKKTVVKDGLIYKKAKRILAKVHTKTLERITLDNPEPELTREELKPAVDIAFVIGKVRKGKDVLTEKQLGQYIHEATVIITLEMFNRHGLIRMDSKGIAHKTKIGKEVDKLLRART